MKTILTKKFGTITLFLLLSFGCNHTNKEDTNKVVNEKATAMFASFFTTLDENYLTKDKIIQIGGLFPEVCPTKKILTLTLRDQNYVCPGSEMAHSIGEVINHPYDKNNGFDLIVYLDKKTKFGNEFKGYLLDLAKNASTILFIVASEGSADELFKDIRENLLKEGRKEVVNIDLAPLDVEESRRRQWEHLYSIFQ